jgi:hypothetical protein
LPRHCQCSPTLVIENPKAGDICHPKSLGRKDTHMLIWTICPSCNNGRWTTLRKGLPERVYCVTCAPKRYKPHLGKHRGGSRISSDGYNLIRMNPNDFFYPMAKQSDGYLLEHRLVMAEHLKRLLHPWEIVHHINGIKTDNRFDNLQLVQELQHKQITILENRIKFLEQKVSALSTELEFYKKEGK